MATPIGPQVAERKLAQINLFHSMLRECGYHPEPASDLALVHHRLHFYCNKVDADHQFSVRCKTALRIVDLDYPSSRPRRRKRFRNYGLERLFNGDDRAWENRYPGLPSLSGNTGDADGVMW